MRNTRVIQSVILLLILLATAGLSFAQPTLATDKADYSPGETVYISGSGFAPGEVVELTITCSDEVHASVHLTSTANSTGSFVNSSFVVRNTDVGMTLTVVATGLSSNRTAFTQFTDATALLYAFADPAGTVCLNRRSDGRFFVNVGETIYLQLKGGPANAFADKNLTSLTPAETSMQVTWRAPNGFIHKITFLHVPITGSTPADRATVLVPWKVGDFTIAGNTGLPGSTMVSAVGTESTQTLLSSADISGVIYCNLPVFYGDISNNQGVQTMNPPSLPTCVSCLQLCGADQALGALAWNTQKCQQGCPSSLTLTASPASPTPGQPVTYSVNAPTGYVPTSVSWVVDGVAEPASSSLTLTRTFATSGAHTVTASVFTSPECVKNLSLTITVAQPVPPTGNCVVINAVQGIPIVPVTLTASGGAGGPYSFSSLNLPAGLILSPSGTISGTPAVSGTFSYTVSIKDSAGTTGTLNCSLTIKPPVSASCVVMNAVRGVAITPVTLTASGGAGGPYSFSASNLPAGLALSSGGTISGTPTVSGTFNYTVTIKDSAGTAGTLNCSVTINAPPDTTSPVCAVYANANPPYMTFQDGGSGIVRLLVTTNLNKNFNMTITPTPAGTTFLPAVPSQPWPMPTGSIITFPQGVTSLIKVTAVRINSKVSAQLTIKATDAVGRSVTCDPVETTVVKLKHDAGVQTFNNLPFAEHFITIENGKPGLRGFDIVVNNEEFKVRSLDDKEVRTLNVRSAMKRGNKNTITLIPRGKNGESADVTIGPGD